MVAWPYDSPARAASTCTPRRPVCSAGCSCGASAWACGPPTNRSCCSTAAGRLLVPLAVIAGCELLRRSAPRTGLLIGTAALIGDTLTQSGLVTVIMYTDLMYAAVLYGPPASARRIPWITGLLTVAGTIVPFALWRVPEALLIGVAVGVVSFAPASTGLIVRNHREAADAALLRAEQTALLAEMDRVQAVTAERSRMARELHDMVANHLSAIAIHSTAALSLDDPATTRQALGVIRENSVEGLAEMRRLIGILRDTGEDTEPAAAPTLDGLGALADGARANGLDVTLEAAPGEGLPAPVELAAYRIVQGVAHQRAQARLGGDGTGRADPARRRAARPGDQPLRRPGGPACPGSGAGLVGMRERVALLHGTFEAGPVADPGSTGGKIWTVRATLPLTEGDLA